MPVTFWQRGKDNNVPCKWAELMKNEVQNATLNIYSDEGHLILFRHAEEIFTDLEPNIA